MASNRPPVKDMTDSPSTAGPDSSYASFSTADLRKIISKAQAELDKRKGAPGGPA